MKNKNRKNRHLHLHQHTTTILVMVMLISSSINCTLWNLPTVLTLSPTLTPTSKLSPTLTNTPTFMPTSTPTPNITIERAKSFSEPILTFISKRPPDFEDDFTQADNGWYIGYPSQNGRFEIDQGQLCIFAGGLTPLIHVGNDNASFRNFVLEVTASVQSIQTHPMASAQIGWKGHTFVLWMDQHWETRYCPGHGCEPKYDEGYDENIIPYTPLKMRVITYGSAFALYLNGQPITYVDDPSVPPERDFSLISFAPTSAIVCYDDFRIWNLDAMQSQ